MKASEILEALRGGEALRECARELLVMLEDTAAEPAAAGYARAEAAESGDFRRGRTAREHSAPLAREHSFLQGTAAERRRDETSGGLHNYDVAAYDADGELPLTVRAGDALATEQAAGAVYCGGSDGGAYRDADIGTAMTMARLEDIDRFFRRDSRRYDSGF
ncbi:MAG: hypothetical protein E7472_05220 [Ruminococcaceae bacterium]|nr:hypothetical protein [Oscillospiraceae bacterium]